MSAPTTDALCFREPAPSSQRPRSLPKTRVPPIPPAHTGQSTGVEKMESEKWGLLFIFCPHLQGTTQPGRPGCLHAKACCLASRVTVFDRKQVFQVQHGFQSCLKKGGGTSDNAPTMRGTEGTPCFEDKDRTLKKKSFVLERCMLTKTVQTVEQWKNVFSHLINKWQKWEWSPQPFLL